MLAMRNGNLMEMMTVWHGAARIDFMLMQHGSSFLEVFDGTVTFRKLELIRPKEIWAGEKPELDLGL
ncbi:MAG: hypothetical protein IPJ94_31340 [Chloroflexi bacterium]|nr:hypothetical protein [Chloroflexota bacterium]